MFLIFLYLWETLDVSIVEEKSKMFQKDFKLCIISKNSIVKMCSMWRVFSDPITYYASVVGVFLHFHKNDNFKEKSAKRKKKKICIQPCLVCHISNERGQHVQFRSFWIFLGYKIFCFIYQSCTVHKSLILT